MLLLSRNRNQTITITTPDGPITVMVSGVTTRMADGRLLAEPRVLLGIEAPKSYAIHRDDAIKRVAS